MYQNKTKLHTKFENPQIPPPEYLKSLFEQEQELIGYLFPTSREMMKKKSGHDMFFTKNVLCAPNSFRSPKPSQTNPNSCVFDEATKCIRDIVSANDELRKCFVQKQEVDEQLGDNENKDGSNANGRENRRGSLNNPSDNPTVDPTLKEAATTTGNNLAKAFVHLQERVNVYVDSSKGTSKAELEAKGIRQKLERKQGLFRMKMMGKRVNACGRSVISPDPNLETCEIGVPIFMCKTLGFPEKVSNLNVTKMQMLVMNGDDYHPGASMVWRPKGETGAYEQISLSEEKHLNINHDSRRGSIN
jgi:DNA-directed RNA polymerase I subunit RPA1